MTVIFQYETSQRRPPKQKHPITGPLCSSDDSEIPRGDDDKGAEERGSGRVG